MQSSTVLFVNAWIEPLANPADSEAKTFPRGQLVFTVTALLVDVLLSTVADSIPDTVIPSPKFERILSVVLPVADAPVPSSAFPRLLFPPPNQGTEPIARPMTK